jgi:ketosteroid isomerase-like protein
MDTRSNDTEDAVRRHLQAFVEQQGLDAIVRDYSDKACFLSEGSAYRGKQAIRGFFEDFIASLPPKAIADFALRSLRVEGDVAYITWSAGREIPLATDTFVVRNGQIVSQTFAMLAARAS